MSTTRAAIQHDQQSSPIPTQQTPQGQTYGQRQPEPVAESSPPLHRYLGNSYVQAMTTKTQRAAAIPPMVQEVLRSPGQPLDPTTRTFMESRFDADFSQVRVHTDPRAAESAQAVNALAYTVGPNVVFGANKYAPSSHNGRRLLAHELAHTIQQRNASGAPPSADPHGIFESSADAAGREVVNGRSVSGDLPACGVGLSRAPAPPADSAFSADRRMRTWRRYAGSEAQKDAARIRKSGKLSSEHRQEINAKLAFFEGEAKDVYIREITPALSAAEQAERREKEANLAYATSTRQSVLDHMPEEDKKLMRRRRHTIRFFSKIQDYQLEEAYRSRLQRYLDEGLEANEYWDLETIEQIVQERAPNAPWREKVRQEFLRQKRLPTLPWYQRHQLEELDKDTQRWTTEERDLARELLWQWFELRNQGHAPKEVKERIFRLVRDLYEQWLKAVDQQRLERYKTHPPSTRAKIRARAQGDEPGVSWFADKNSPGPLRLIDLERYMRVIDRGDDTVPGDAVYIWVREYRKRTNKELLEQAEYLQKAATTAQLGATLGLGRSPALGMQSPAPPPAKPAAPPVAGLKPAPADVRGATPPTGAPQASGGPAGAAKNSPIPPVPRRLDVTQGRSSSAQPAKPAAPASTPPATPPAATRSVVVPAPVKPPPPAAPVRQSPASPFNRSRWDRLKMRLGSKYLEAVMQSKLSNVVPTQIAGGSLPGQTPAVIAKTKPSPAAPTPDLRPGTPAPPQAVSPNRATPTPASQTRAQTPPSTPSRSTTTGGTVRMPEPATPTPGVTTGPGVGAAVKAPGSPNVAGNVGDLYKMINENVGEYSMLGAKAKIGNTFHRRILVLARQGGPTNDIRPLMRLLADFEAEARAVGATELRIMGLAIENANVTRMQRVLDRIGATINRIDAKTIEVVMPLTQPSGPATSTAPTPAGPTPPRTSTAPTPAGSTRPRPAAITAPTPSGQTVPRTTTITDLAPAGPSTIDHAPAGALPPAMAPTVQAVTPPRPKRLDAQDYDAIPIHARQGDSEQTPTHS